MKKRKRPLRTCVGCNVIRPKRELVRVLVGNDGKKLEIDITGKLPGRGAYLCRSNEEIEKVQSGKLPPKEDTIFTINEKCRLQALERNAFNRSFKKKIQDINI